VLVGRESEQRSITDLLAAARVGDSGVLVLLGEPGIGKTALLDDAMTLVENMQVLVARGVEPERSVPFGGLLQLLRPLLPLLEHLPGPQSRALGAALLLEPGDDVDPSRFAVGAGTLSLLCRAAEDRPLAVFIDDAHALDVASAEALAFAARRLVTDAVAVLVTMRDDEYAGSPWSALPTLHVGGLDLRAASELVVGAVRSGIADEQLERLHGATAGNPLALLELSGHPDRLDALRSDRPWAVSAELTRGFIGRVQGLSPEARLALLVAAADARSLTAIHQACRRLGLSEPRLSEAEDAGLLTVSADRVHFRHPLVRSAVYGSAETETRRRVHRALAAVVPEDEVDRLAWHLSEGAVAPDEPTATTLDAVARRASSRGAFAISAAAHERAAQLSGCPEGLARRLAAAGEAAWLAGSAEQAIGLLDRALDHADVPSLRARIQELRGEVATRCGPLDDALSTLVQAASEVAALDPDTAVRLLSDAVHVCFYLADPATALKSSDRIEALVGQTHDPRTRFEAAMASGMASILGGAGEHGARQLRLAVGLAPALGSAGDQPRLPRQLLASLWLREMGDSRALLDGALDRLRERAALGVLPYLLMHIARDDATTDRWDDAETGYLEAIRLATESGQSTDLGASMAGLTWLRARQGREQECRDLALPALELCRSRHIRVGTSWLHFALGDLEAGLGRPARAAEHYERLGETLASSALADPDQSPAPELVECYLQLGRSEDAAAVAKEFHGKAAAKGQPWSLARAHRAMALCESGPSAEEHFATALDLHHQTPDRYETARSELALGATLRRRRRRVDSRPYLRSALATFEQLGAGPWADKAARELNATGVTAHRRELSPVQELTPQERQISRLLVQGRTTRETAAALFLSPKTVEYHLRHVYLKLGIRSREALTEAFRP
jgi:DNA-binding CsgD family transcriptional regulator